VISPLRRCAASPLSGAQDSVLPPALLTQLPPSLARLRRLEGGRTQWPGKAGSTGALERSIARRRLGCFVCTVGQNASLPRVITGYL